MWGGSEAARCLCIAILLTILATTFAAGVPAGKPRPKGGVKRNQKRKESSSVPPGGVSSYSSSPIPPIPENIHRTHPISEDWEAKTPGWIAMEKKFGGSGGRLFPARKDPSQPGGHVPVKDRREADTLMSAEGGVFGLPAGEEVAWGGKKGTVHFGSDGTVTITSHGTDGAEEAQTNKKKKNRAKKKESSGSNKSNNNNQTKSETGEDDDKGFSVVPLYDAKKSKSMKCGGMYAFELVPEGFSKPGELEGAFFEIWLSHGKVVLENVLRSKRPEFEVVKAPDFNEQNRDPKKWEKVLRPNNMKWKIPYEMLEIFGDTNPQVSKIIRFAIHDCNMLPFVTLQGENGGGEQTVPLRFSARMHYQPGEARGAQNKKKKKGHRGGRQGGQEAEEDDNNNNNKKSDDLRETKMVKVQGYHIEGAWLSATDENAVEAASASHEYSKKEGTNMMHQLPPLLSGRMRAAVGPYLVYVEEGGKKFEMPKMPKEGDMSLNRYRHTYQKLCGLHDRNSPITGARAAAQHNLDIIEREVINLQSDMNQRAYASVHFTDHMLRELYNDFCFGAGPRGGYSPLGATDGVLADANKDRLRGGLGTWSPEWYFVTLDQKIMKRTKILITNVHIKCDETKEHCPVDNGDPVWGDQLPVLYHGSHIRGEATLVELGPAYFADAVDVEISISSSLTNADVVPTSMFRTKFSPSASIPGGMESRFYFEFTSDLGGSMHNKVTSGPQTRDLYQFELRIKVPEDPNALHVANNLQFVIDNRPPKQLIGNDYDLSPPVKQRQIPTSLKRSEANGDKKVPIGALVVRSAPKPPTSNLQFSLKRVCKTQSACQDVWLPSRKDKTPSGRPTQHDSKTGVELEKYARLFNGNNHTFEVNITEYLGSLPGIPGGEFPLEVQMPDQLKYQLRVVSKRFVNWKTLRTTFHLIAITPDSWESNVAIAGNAIVVRGTDRTAVVKNPSTGGGSNFPRKNSNNKGGSSAASSLDENSYDNSKHVLTMKYPIALQNPPINIVTWITDGKLNIQAKLETFLEGNKPLELLDQKDSSLQFSDWRGGGSVDNYVRTLEFNITLSATRPTKPSYNIPLVPVLEDATSGCTTICVFNSKQCSQRVDLRCEGLTVNTPLRMTLPIRHFRGGKKAKVEGENNFPPLEGNLTEADELVDFALSLHFESVNIVGIQTVLEQMQVNWSPATASGGSGPSDDAGAEDGIQLPSATMGGRKFSMAGQTSYLQQQQRRAARRNKRGLGREEKGDSSAPLPATPPTETIAYAMGTNSSSPHFVKTKVFRYGAHSVWMTSTALVYLTLGFGVFLALVSLFSRMHPAPKPNDWVAINSNMIKAKSWWHYFCSHHLWLGVFIPCNPQAAEHRAFLLGAVLSYQAMNCANSDHLEILQSSLVNLTVSTIYRYFLEQLLFRGKSIPQPTSAESRNSLRKACARSPILGTCASQGILPPLPRYILRPRPWFVAPIFGSIFCAKYFLDNNASHIGMETAMTRWWHQYITVIVLDAVLVQMVIIPSLLFAKSLALSAYPRIIQGNSLLSPYQYGHGFMVLECEYPVVLDEEPLMPGQCGGGGTSVPVAVLDGVVLPSLPPGSTQISEGLLLLGRLLGLDGGNEAIVPPTLQEEQSGVLSEKENNNNKENKKKR